MKSSKRKIIIGGIVAVLGIALLAYVAHVLTAALDSQPGDVSKAQFVVQLGALTGPERKLLVRAELNDKLSL